jgi:UDPglucose 6-dehydrogenase
MAQEKGRHPQLLHAVMEINDDRRPMTVHRMEEMLGTLNGKTIGLLGLSFKPNTDDMRDAPSIDIAKALLEAGAQVRAFDPVAMNIAAPLIPGITMSIDPYTMAESCDALIVVTDWNEFKHLDLERVRNLMNQPVLLDGRNIYDPQLMLELGFKYRGLGRGYNGAYTNEQVEHQTITSPLV